jgi:hypothetical protein
MEHEIIRDHATNRSRGFGFIVFDAEKTVDELLAKKGNMIDLNGSQVSLRVVLPKLCNPIFVQLGLHELKLIDCDLVISKRVHLVASSDFIVLVVCLLGDRLLALHCWK